MKGEEDGLEISMVSPELPNNFKKLSELIKAYPNNFIMEERVTSTTGGKSLYVKNAKGK